MAPGRRLIRRRPLLERIKSYLDPFDFLLWLSEELETSDWDQWGDTWAFPFGIGLNIAMLIARANTVSNSTAHDDVFGDDSLRAGFLSWLATLVVHGLSLASFANAFYTFWRKRHYRLFESSIDEQLTTPSAHRVKVNSSPVSASPLRYISNMISENSASARAHPDPTRDVWEVSVWDPIPASLKMFCLFSPGHVLVYWLFLPTSTLDPYPSTTVLTTVILAGLLTAQLYGLQAFFIRQTKDNSLIQKEVLHEYDTKFVHPRTQKKMRDVGTQFSTRDHSFDSVEEFTPVTIVNSGYRTNPNPNYQGLVDPEGSDTREITPVRETPSRPVLEHRLSTPARPMMDQRTSSFQTPQSQQQQRRDFSSPARPQTDQHVRHSQYRASTGGGFGQQQQQQQRASSSSGSGASNRHAGSRQPAGDGGNLGVYAHAASPLKKSASTTFAPNPRLDRIRHGGVRRESGRF